MKRKKVEYTGYVSKAGKNALYKIAGRFTTPEAQHNRGDWRDGYCGC